MSQRSRLLLVLLAVSIPMVALSSTSLAVAVQSARERAERDAEASAKAAALTAASFIDGHTRALKATAVGIRDAHQMTEPDLREELLLRRQANPDWGGMSVVDENGIVLAGSRPSSRGVDLSDREYLQEMFATGHVVVSDGLLTVGEEVLSVLIAAPVHFDDGTTGGVIGQLTLLTLSETLAEAVRPGTRFGLTDRGGRTIADTDVQNSASLLHIGSRPDVRRALVGETGTVEAEIDSTNALVGFAPVPGLGWAMTIAEDSEDAYAEANTLLLRGAMFIGVTVLAVLVGGWVIGGRLNRSHEAVQAAGQAEVEARQRAETALRSREQFISLASHELRNPVAAIYGLGQLLGRLNERGTLSREQVSEYAHSITESGGHLARLVEDLLDVSRLEGGSVDLRPEEVLVATLLERALVETPSAARRVHVEGAGDSISVRVDADRATQILVNLLDNAAKYSPEGAEVFVHVAEADGVIRIAVRDHGIGLPPEDLEQLFQPFARATNARDASIPGLGLGLHLSRRLAEAHGGRLEAHSEGVGAGSTFTLTLPLPPALGAEVNPKDEEGESEPVQTVDTAGV